MIRLLVASVVLMVLPFGLALADTFIVPHILEARSGSIEFGGSSQVQGVPGGFFGAGSNVYAARVALRNIAGALKEYEADHGTFPPGASQTVPVELLQLSLVSVNPIAVHNSTTNTDSFFDVFVDLRSSSAPGQHLTLTGDAAENGGWVMDSFFDITYRIEFAEPGRPRDGSLVLTNLGQAGLVSQFSGSAVGQTDFPWWESFPGGSPAPGLVLGATETELTPFWLNVAGDSIQAELVEVVPEPATMTLLGVGGAWLICRRRKRKAT
ncbi:MAG TPA: PEP-CTERM sorting domain-containing protein [Phycisphaerae bacterium]|jgi:hypothetical protein|nr:PEP-CTERM sorting domain-containing protein [Phycisphaerae bacterium]